MGTDMRQLTPWIVAALGIGLCAGAALRATTPAVNYVPSYSALSGGFNDSLLREMLVELKLIKGEVRLMREQQTASAASPMTLPQLVAGRFVEQRLGNLKRVGHIA